MAMCEQCWTEARKRHAAGEGASVTEVYNALVDEDWCAPTPKQREEREEVIAILRDVLNIGNEEPSAWCVIAADRILARLRTHSPEEQDERAWLGSCPDCGTAKVAGCPACIPVAAAADALAIRGSPEEPSTPGYFYFAEPPHAPIPWQKIAEMLREAGHDVMVQPGFRRSPEEPVGYIVVGVDAGDKPNPSTASRRVFRTLIQAQEIREHLEQHGVFDAYVIFPIGQPLDGEEERD